MKRLLIITFFLGMNFLASAQNDEAVKKVINTYFEGYTAGDTTKLKDAFHPSFHLSWVNPWAQGERAYTQVDRKGMFEFFTPNWTDMTITSRIDELMVSKDAATVKATVVLKDIVTWTDYISLLKINNRWWIVSKVSEGERAK